MAVATRSVVIKPSSRNAATMAVRNAAGPSIFNVISVSSGRECAASSRSADSGTARPFIVACAVVVVETVAVEQAGDDDERRDRHGSLLVGVGREVAAV
jgi:hypothetical protein